jgi:hypothetical protein
VAGQKLAKGDPLLTITGDAFTLTLKSPDASVVHTLHAHTGDTPDARTALLDLAFLTRPQSRHSGWGVPKPVLLWSAAALSPMVFGSLSGAMAMAGWMDMQMAGKAVLFEMTYCATFLGLMGGVSWGLAFANYKRGEKEQVSKQYLICV